MYKKIHLRKKYKLLRKKKYFEIDNFFFIPLLKKLKKKFKDKKINISIYYPSKLEINVLKLLELDYFLRNNILLPKIFEKNQMKFYKWRNNDVLTINNYGLLEPLKSKEIIPEVMLIPLLVFDKKKNRIGYGKGFYDRYLNRANKKIKNIMTIGVAFSFQKYHNVPVDDRDVKLNYILTEKGIF